MIEETRMPDGLRERIRTGQAVDVARGLLRDERRPIPRSVVAQAAELASERDGVDPKAVEDRIMASQAEAARALSDPAAFTRGPLVVEEVSDAEMAAMAKGGLGR